MNADYESLDAERAGGKELEPARGRSAAVSEAAERVRARWSGQPPQVAVILGTGLGSLADAVEDPVRIPFAEIPHFPRSTALSHKGQLVCGHLLGVPLIALAGRCHLYEGYSVDEAVFPTRVLHALGCRTLVVSNASGGLNPQFRGGDVMIIEDHLNLMFRSPASDIAGGLHHGAAETRGANWPYDTAWIELAAETARQAGFVAHRGCYVAVTGPNYETRAELRFLRRIGGDAVGMSTIPEALVAAGCGMRVLALSVVANVASPDAPAEVSGAAVVDSAATAEPKLRCLVEAVLSQQSREF